MSSLEVEAGRLSEPEVPTEHTEYTEELCKPELTHALLMARSHDQGRALHNGCLQGGAGSPSRLRSRAKLSARKTDFLPCIPCVPWATVSCCFCIRVAAAGLRPFA